MAFVRIFTIGPFGGRGTSLSPNGAATAAEYWRRVHSIAPPLSTMLAYEESTSALPPKPGSDQKWYDRCAAALAKGQTFGDLHQCADDLRAWALLHGIATVDLSTPTPAPTRETVVAAEPGPGKPPRTVIVQEWVAAMEREHPGEIAVRAWDALHSLIARGQ